MASKPVQTLEEQLLKVVEQDGKILNTAQGVRMVRKTSNKQQKKQIPDFIPASAPVTQDSIAILDRETVNAIVGKGKGIPQEIRIQKGEHVRSQFVVSLQHILLQPKELHEEKTHVPSGNVMSHLVSRPVESYAAVSTDLMADSDPWFTSHQFTADDFDANYASVYGRPARWRSAFQNTWQFVASLFQKVEHIEQEAVRDVEVALEVTEVPRFSFVRALGGFAALALIVTLPANAISLYRFASTQKDVVTQVGTGAVSSLSAAAGASSLPASADALRQASAQFRSIDALLGSANHLAFGIASVLPTQVRSARALAEVGDKSSEAARLLALGFDKIFSDPGRRLDERLDVLQAYANSSLTLLSDASQAALSVNPSDVPASQQADVKKMLSALSDSTQAVREFSGLAGVLSELSGKEHLRKYLVIFQNPTELRPTGGFMGSFAEVTVDRGAITDVRVPSGGTYDLKGMLLARVLPPKPLELVANRWEFQDSNWSPDFPTAASKIRWFWDQSGQSTVDGVITINATFVQKLLDITGPIAMPAYGKTIDSSNFLLETQKAVEVEYDKQANTPKKFVGDLATEVMSRMKSFSKDDWLKVAAMSSDALETKDIQVALTNPDEEAYAERNGWNGRLKSTTGDALALVESNIAGQKTDGVITEQATQHVQIHDDGSVTETVSLTRTHHGIKGTMFNGVRNVSYLRAFVPVGATLVSSSGFETPSSTFFQIPDPNSTTDTQIGAIEATETKTTDGVTVAQEDGRASFGGWMQLDPGETKTVTLSYRLPMTVTDMLSSLDDQSTDGSNAKNTSVGAYDLLLTSQSGKSDRTIETTIDVPPTWTVSWKHPDELVSKGSSLTYQSTWDRDTAVVLLLTSHAQKEATQTR
jgi:hypothetical protein